MKKPNRCQSSLSGLLQKSEIREETTLFAMDELMNL